MIFSFHPFQWPNCCIYMMDYYEQLCTSSSLCEVSLTDDCFWYEFCAIHFLNVCLCVCVCVCASAHTFLYVAYFSVVSFVKEILILNHKKKDCYKLLFIKKTIVFPELIIEKARSWPPMMHAHIGSFTVFLSAKPSCEIIFKNLSS